MGPGQKPGSSKQNGSLLNFLAGSQTPNVKLPASKCMKDTSSTPMDTEAPPTSQEVVLQLPPLLPAPMQLSLLLPYPLWLLPWIWTSLWTPMPSKVPHHLAATMVPLRPLQQPAPPHYYSPGSKHYCHPPTQSTIAAPMTQSTTTAPAIPPSSSLAAAAGFASTSIPSATPATILAPPPAKATPPQTQAKAITKQATAKKSPKTSQPKPAAKPVATSQPPSLCS